MCQYNKLIFLLQFSEIMTTFNSDVNLESQLQVAFSTIAELRNQLSSIEKMNWSLEMRLRVDGRALWEGARESASVL